MNRQEAKAPIWVSSSIPTARQQNVLPVALPAGGHCRMQAAGTALMRYLSHDHEHVSPFGSAGFGSLDNRSYGGGEVG